MWIDHLIGSPPEKEKSAGGVCNARPRAKRRHTEKEGKGGEEKGGKKKNGAYFFNLFNTSG